MKIKTDSIKLSQFLKLAGFCDTGGQAKIFIEEHEILVNNQPETRKGRKLVKGDVIVIEGEELIIE